LQKGGQKETKGKKKGGTTRFSEPERQLRGDAVGDETAPETKGDGERKGEEGQKQTLLGKGYHSSPSSGLPRKLMSLKKKKKV